MSQQCRICLQFKKNVKLLKNDDPESAELKKMFTNVTNFEWIETSKVASTVCKECEETLKCLQRLQEMCLISYNYILEQIDQVSDFEFDVSIGLNKSIDAEVPNNDTEVIIIRTFDSNNENEAQTASISKTVYSDNDEPQNKNTNTQHKEEATQNISYESLEESSECESEPEYQIDKEAGKNLVKKKVAPQTELDLKLPDKLGGHIDFALFKCVCCSINFFSKENLDSHKCNNPKKENDSKSQNKKPQKSEQFNTNEPFYVKTEEKKQNEIKCKVCEEVFTKHSDLSLHKIMHLDPDLLCTSCGRSFSTKSRLKVHEAVHTQLKRHECKVCYRKFRLRSTLQNHIYALHERETRYKCELCHYIAIQPNMLKKHMLLHTTRKLEFEQFKCAICKKGHFYKQSLTKHMREEHNYGKHIFQEQDDEDYKFFT